MNALVWLLIPVVVTCFAAWWINQRAQAAERDDPDALSEAELTKMQRALEAKQELKAQPPDGEQRSAQ